MPFDSMSKSRKGNIRVGLHGSTSFSEVILFDLAAFFVTPSCGFVLTIFIGLQDIPETSMEASHLHRWKYSL